ncbi:MAG: DUF5107 domain-containing protein, partial [Verrucomicrobia bacterium]|nr:DUF5107 domain-containing protein [Verrucomicrobiota bacterium]
MVKIDEYDTTLLTHAVLPVGPIPTVCDPEGVYPYESFAETSRRPEVKRYRMVALENERLRATICPDLGGRVHSMLDKASGQEALFVPASLCPVRILPRMGFIPGGIEVSFPIAHTPVQLERVHVQAERRGQRGLVWCGERELHSGLHWTVEYSLGAGEPYLTQRVYFQNRTPAPCPWTSWSNAAVPARPDTEFHFPGGPVLRHGATVDTIDWAREGPRCVGEVRRMTGYFWLAADAPVFGAFTPSLGQGLYHLADARTAPGIKLWTYGLGVHERWARAASLSGEGYVEIQGGPLRDQSQRARLDSGEARAHVEFWLPATAPLDLDSIRLPTPALPPLDTVPIFDWPPRPAVRYWQAVFEAYAAKAIGRLPGPPALGEHWWAPSGMDELGTALEWAVAVTDGRARDGWRFQHGAWLAGRGEVEGALAALEGSRDDRAAALAGRLH